MQNTSMAEQEAGQGVNKSTHRMVGCRLESKYDELGNAEGWARTKGKSRASQKQSRQEAGAQEAVPQSLGGGRGGEEGGVKTRQHRAGHRARTRDRTGHCQSRMQGILAAAHCHFRAGGAKAEDRAPVQRYGMGSTKTG